MATQEYLHAKPQYEIVLDGRNITSQVDTRLMNLTLSESRGEEADKLDITLDDSDGRLALPGKGSKIALKLGWAGHGLVDKGTYEVDEVEHQGAPDRIVVHARSAELKRQLRTRSEHSYHNSTLGQIVRSIAQRNGLQVRVDAQFENLRVDHIDQTHESDLNFCSRLARQYDAVCTVKKGKLAFIAIDSKITAGGQTVEAATLTRAEGDSHNYHTAARNDYSGVRAYWNDADRAEKRSATQGAEDNEKRLKDTYGSEAEAQAAAKAEMGRINRAKATMGLKLALARPDLMPQTPLKLQGFKAEIDDTPWLVVKIQHELGDAGFTSKLTLETRAK
ncbi:contractile injection system protein, VgrG/Pvc8 family [Delftia tsuruhatensis]|uniref:Contractile injection system protein, VgrG/Pvc8 family n=1 Tax=Delftia tsuruhatensis TaxID=180282 RepID=A0AAX3SSU2_9BURK|nr:contractile injection system protein, VgrG/Pvc8 family [Delftia tsuruhatensis]AOV05886.1 late control protein [Delftia tsuruhatensis]MDH2231270.1 contractile injection system protein, VgrG/Pvc8 family [Delftia tsuruhatensis]WFF83150.1 contractile injection system protein, VgrG/Pvc8 family [Delftia tsuruhatensis]